MIAKLSLGASASGLSPAASSATLARASWPATLARPSPIKQAAMYESGVRSPLAPTEPSCGMHGSTRWLSSVHNASSTSSRTAE